MIKTILPRTKQIRNTITKDTMNRTATLLALCWSHSKSKTYRTFKLGF